MLSSARESASTTARVHASRGSRLGRNKDWTCTGREVQFLALATRGQEVTASGLEDGPVGDWLVLAVGGRPGREVVEVDASQRGHPLLTPDFGMTFFFWCQISHLCGSDGSEERCQFGVKGRALQLLRAFSVTERQSASGMEQCQGFGEGPIISWRPSCPSAPSSTEALPPCGQLGPPFRAKSIFAQSGQ